MENTTKAKSGFFYGYWVLLACFLCQVIGSGFTMYCFSVYVKPLTTDFGWNRTGIMAASTVMNIVSACAAILVGLKLSRIGAKLMIIIGAILFGLGFGLLSLTQNIWQYYLCYAIVGLGYAAMGIVPTTAVVSNWFKRRRGFAIGILGSGIGVGGFIMPLLTAGIISSFSWRSAYLVTGAIALCVIIPVSLFIVRGRPEDMGLLPDGDAVNKVVEKVKKNAGPEVPFNLSQAMKTPAFWLMLVAFFTFNFANQSNFQNHAPHLQDIGFSAAVAASAISFVGIGSAFGKFGLGWLCDFIPPKYILVLGILFQSTAVLILMTVTPTSPLILIWVYAILLGLGVGSWLPGLSMTTSSTFGTASYGAIFGFISFGLTFGGAIGPLVAGMIYDATKSYYLSFIVSFCFYAVSLLAMMLVMRPKQLKKPVIETIK